RDQILATGERQVDRRSEPGVEEAQLEDLGRSRVRERSLAIEQQLRPRGGSELREACGGNPGRGFVEGLLRERRGRSHHLPGDGAVRDRTERQGGQQEEHEQGDGKSPAERAEPVCPEEGNGAELAAKE